MDAALKRIIVAAMLVLPLSAQAQAAATTNDQAVLSADQLFQNRGLESFIGFCVSTIISENPHSVAYHTQRVAFCQTVMGTINGPGNYKVNIAEVSAANATVIGDATQSGTVALTTANADAQQALVTDTDLSNAIAAAFNIFIGQP